MIKVCPIDPMPFIVRSKRETSGNEFISREDNFWHEIYVFGPNALSLTLFILGI